MNLYDWAAKWAVPMAALQDLQGQLGMLGTEDEPNLLETEINKSEAAVQAAVRLEAADFGIRLWRNNVGALVDERGVPVRYGLANDTKALNKNIKSADLIGGRRKLITPADVGTTVMQFVSRECKPRGWAWSGTEREEAQLRWAQLILAMGGDAAFVTGPGSFGAAQ